MSRGVGNIRHPLAIAQILPGIVYAVDEGVSVSGLHMGRGNTFWSVISGVNRFRINLNQKGFDPTKQLAQNPTGDAFLGRFGASAPFFNSFCWQRQPAENMSFGRNFRIGREGKYNLQARVEFQDIFNRLFCSVPAPGGLFGGPNPSTPAVSGYGFVSWLKRGCEAPKAMETCPGRGRANSHAIYVLSGADAW